MDANRSRLRRSLTPSTFTTIIGRGCAAPSPLATFWCKNRGLGLVARIAVLAGNCKVGRISDDDRSDWANSVGAERLGSGGDGGPEGGGPKPGAPAGPSSGGAAEPFRLAGKAFTKSEGARPRRRTLFKKED